MTATEIIFKRYSPVIFSEKEVDHEMLLQLFEAARWAPSAFNEQPWRFIVCPKKDSKQYEKLFDCLADTNKEWAKSAPVLILVMAKKFSSYNGKPNPYHQYDTGMAMMNFIIAAMEQGIYVHQMGGYSQEKAREHFNITEEYSLISVAAVGYHGDIASLPEHLQKRALKPRTRKEIAELLI